MKFSTREDIEAPMEAVFASLSEFEVYERAAVRRGVEVRRLGDTARNGLGTSWRTRFPLRGTLREVEFEITTYLPNSTLRIGIASRNVEGEVTCDLFGLSQNRTRLTVACEVRPLTLAARLLLQSLKLSKARITRKYKERVADIARDIEARCRRSL